jgi:hypothetical protein
MMKADVKWLETFGPVRLGVYAGPGQQWVVRMQEIDSGRSFDLHGCQRQRFLDEFRDMSVIESDAFFAFGRRLLEEGCTCDDPECAAQMQLQLLAGD